MKKIIVFGLLLVLCACANHNEPTVTTPEPTNPSVEEKNNPVSDVLKSAFDIREVSAEHVDTNNPYVIIVRDTEYTVPMELTSKENLSDVCIWVLSDGEYTAEGVKCRGSLVYQFNTLEKGQAVLVCDELGETIPFSGISYVDNAGVQHAFGFACSGEDGSLLLVPITIISNPNR